MDSVSREEAVLGPTVGVDPRHLLVVREIPISASVHGRFRSPSLTRPQTLTLALAGGGGGGRGGEGAPLCAVEMEMEMWADARADLGLHGEVEVEVEVGITAAAGNAMAAAWDCWICGLGREGRVRAAAAVAGGRWMGAAMSEGEGNEMRLRLRVGVRLLFSLSP